MIRLDKLLSHMNLGSRKEVKQFIRKGFVEVNGTQVFDDDMKVSEMDEIIFLDNVIEYKDFVYFMLNKPEDVVSATYDNNLPTVIDILSDYKKMNIFPVGRLDIDTHGLLLITNDGKLAHKLLSPKNHVDKTYYVKFDGTFKDEYYQEFNNGIVLDDGYKTKGASIKVSNNEAYLTIYEGKFHQVKRMFEALNMKVTYLQRIKFGPLTLDKSLEEGQFRKLTDEEIKELKDYETRED